MKEQRYRDPKAVHAWNNGEGGRAARKRYAERNKEAIRARLAARLSRSNSVSKAQLIEEVARLLSYDGETGELRYCDAPREMFSTQSAWKRHSTFLVGKPAGSVLESGVCRWSNMIDRCTNPSNKRYVDYQGRGITVCERWMTFANFLADMGERPDATSLDRIDNDAGYFKENCRWATALEQMNNTRRNTFVEYLGRR
ncbi:hypothetical protein ACM6ST_006459, partial [Pseudomonas aeruginosa]